MTIARSSQGADQQARQDIARIMHMQHDPGSATQHRRQRPVIDMERPRRPEIPGDDIGDHAVDGERIRRMAAREGR